MSHPTPGALARLRSQYRRAPDEPPHTPGPIPWLGVALDYGRDAGAMLAALKRAHGDTFSVFLAGDRVTFVTNPHDYKAVLTHKSLDFHQLANQISASAFGHGLEAIERLEAHGVAKLSIDRLRGEPLAAMTRRAHRCFEEVLLGGEAPGAVPGLYDWIGALVFRATGRSVFGEGFDGAVSRADFDALDARFPLLVAGLPAGLLGVSGIRRALQQAMAAEREGAAAITVDRHRLFQEHGDPSEIGAYQLAFLWATQANTVPAAFWTLAYAMRDGAAIRALTDEVRRVLDDAPTDPETGRPAMTSTLLRELVLVDSALNEALRLTSGSLTIRVALEDVTLELESGPARIRRGERVGIYPWLTHHDPAIYASPETYRYDRYVEDGAPKRSFTLDGRRLTHFLMPFGGGVSMCPGRHFARNEIKALVAVLLQNFELRPIDVALPGFVEGRAGLGVFAPAGDVPAQIDARR